MRCAGRTKEKKNVNAVELEVVPLNFQESSSIESEVIETLKIIVVQFLKVH